MVLKGQISLEDRANSSSVSQLFNVTNTAPIGAQQFGNENTADVTQNIGANATETLKIVESLKQSIEILPQDNRDIVTESLAIVEEEVLIPTRPSRLKTALFTLWSVGKDIVSFTNAVTALSERFKFIFPV